MLPTLDKGEGFPVSLLEAMANGKIVLGSAVPGIKDQLQEFLIYSLSQVIVYNYQISFCIIVG